jgi:hypothetical protein
MTDDEKATWGTLGASKDPVITGYNAWIQIAQTNLPLYHGLQGYWNFNEIDNASVADHSGNGLTGTLLPAPPGNAPQRQSSLNSKFGRSMRYDGIDDRVGLGSPDALKITNNLTVELMCKLADSPGSLMEMFGYFSGEEYGYTVQLEDSGTTAHFRIVIGITSQSSGSATLPPLGEWVYLAARYNDPVVSILVNDQLAQFTTPGGDIEHSANDFTIGATASGGSPFNGNHDEVRVYNRYLSDAELALHRKILINSKRRQPRLQGAF